MKTYKVRIKVLSPLHIGSGEVYAPTEFFVNEREKWLGVLDFPRWCEAASRWNPKALKAFMKLCAAKDAVSFVNLLDFMDQVSLTLLKNGKDGFIKRRIEVSRGFLEVYRGFKAKKKDPARLAREFNRFEIFRTAYSSNENLPILPGSSVKGALRTAVLNLRRSKARSQNIKDYCPDCRRPKHCNSRKLEAEILEYFREDPRNFKTDPFRLIKLSDFRPVKGSGVKMKIVFAVNRRKDGSRSRGPYQILEVVEAGAVFEGTMTVLDPPETSRRDLSVKNPVTFEEILQALRNFYGREMERKRRELAAMGVNFEVLGDKEGVPLILGRYSGAECVTIEGFRSILVRGRGGRKRCLPHATTLWLASEDPRGDETSSLKPFGWTRLEMIA
ncbi:MAG TPA: type III-A CRISPR-associated RAMP protein Csm5 [Thermodesulfobacteriaceae bacterium]|nr:type III-A CRISPR-associated RAMP protein Csm5 [Thermodesulfobacteriaceae bacterium]